VTENSFVKLLQHCWNSLTRIILSLALNRIQVSKLFHQAWATTGRRVP